MKLSDDAIIKIAETIRRELAGREYGEVRIAIARGTVETIKVTEHKRMKDILAT